MIILVTQNKKINETCNLKHIDYFNNKAIITFYAGVCDVLLTQM